MKQNKKKSTPKPATLRWQWIAIALLIFAGAGFGLFRLATTGQTSLPAEISVAQAAQMKDNGAFILDVREPSEWAQQHIPGTTLIPLGQLADRLNEVPKDREIVVVCRSGNRSQEGRDILLKAGFTQATSMSGGVNQWKSAGLPIATGQ